MILNMEKFIKPRKFSLPGEDTQLYCRAKEMAQFIHQNLNDFYRLYPGFTRIPIDGKCRSGRCFLLAEECEDFIDGNTEYYENPASEWKVSQLDNLKMKLSRCDRATAITTMNFEKDFNQITEEDFHEEPLFSRMELITKENNTSLMTELSPKPAVAVGDTKEQPGIKLPFSQPPSPSNKVSGDEISQPMEVPSLAEWICLTKGSQLSNIFHVQHKYDGSPPFVVHFTSNPTKGKMLDDKVWIQSTGHIYYSDQGMFPAPIQSTL